MPNPVRATSTVELSKRLDTAEEAFAAINQLIQAVGWFDRSRLDEVRRHLHGAQQPILNGIRKIQEELARRGSVLMPHEERG